MNSIDSDIKEHSDFESLDAPQKAEDNEFGYQDNNEAEAEATLGANAEDAIVDNNLAIESDENSYSNHLLYFSLGLVLLFLLSYLFINSFSS